MPHAYGEMGPKYDQLCTLEFGSIVRTYRQNLLALLAVHRYIVSDRESVRVIGANIDNYGKADEILSPNVDLSIHGIESYVDVWSYERVQRAFLRRFPDDHHIRLSEELKLMGQAFRPFEKILPFKPL